MTAKKSKPNKGEKAAEPKEKRVEIEVEIGLSDKEKVKRGEEACRLMNERDGLVLERKSVSDRYAARIKSLDSDAKRLLEEFKTGREKTTVNALEKKNYPKSVVEYVFKGKVVKTREMTFADRQSELPLKEKPLTPELKKAADFAAKSVAADLAAKSASAAAKPNEDKACVTVPGKLPPRGERQALTPAGQAINDAIEKKSKEDIGSVIAAETGRKTKTSSVDGART